MKGKPITIKCPKCKRGKFGHAGTPNVVRTPDVLQREAFRRGHSRRGRVTVILTSMTCQDCGHVWETTLVHDLHDAEVAQMDRHFDEHPDTDVADDEEQAFREDNAGRWED
jgi:uncharacterized Zn finger protein